jgi:type II restriction enzyme
MKLGFEESQSPYTSGSQKARAWTEAWVSAWAYCPHCGSNILLGRVPESGKIQIVQNGLVRAKEAVLAEWQRTLFLRNESPETRGWLLDVMRCVESLGKPEFTLDEVYAFERHLGDLYPGNQNVKPKIRQQLQYLRDRGFVEFVSRGSYRLRS